MARVKEESEKAGLKLNLQKIKIIVSGSITLWQIDGENVETIQMVTAATKLKDTCSLEENL